MSISKVNLYKDPLKYWPFGSPPTKHFSIIIVISIDGLFVFGLAPRLLSSIHKPHQKAQENQVYHSKPLKKSLTFCFMPVEKVKIIVQTKRKIFKIP